MNGAWPSGGERPVVGFIGLGRMGQPMAANVLRAGFELVAFDVRGEALEPLVESGARVAESAPGLAAMVDVLITMLPGPPQVEAVMLGPGGAFQALREGAVWIDMSTSTPAAGRTAADDGTPRGVAVIDAPVAGMVKGATTRHAPGVRRWRRGTTWSGSARSSRRWATRSASSTSGRAARGTR